MSNNEYEWNRVFKVLNGNKILIRGNHDTDNKIKRYIEEYNIKDNGLAMIYKYKKFKFYLSHYPTFTANFEADKIPLINLFGHTHSKELFYNNNPYMYNVAADAHNCTPVSIEKIIRDIQSYASKLKT